MHFFVDVDAVPGMEGLECNNWGEISVVVADDVYIRSGSNIIVQTFNTYQYINLNLMMLNYYINMEEFDSKMKKLHELVEI